jgi:thioredoxin 1
MKISFPWRSDGQAKAWYSQLRGIAVLGAVVLLSLLWGSLAVDLPCWVTRPQEVGAASPASVQGIPNPKSLPMLLDFGRGVCIPCKMMKPILEEIAREYDGKLLVKILEIDQHRDLMKQFRVHLIPTQIFINPKGEIVHRHEGFMDKASVVNILNQMGVKK